METHIFDIDHTIIKYSTGRCFLGEALKHRYLKISSILTFPFKFLLYKMAYLNPDFMEKLIRTFTGIDYEKLLNSSYLSYNRLGRKKLFQGAVDRIKMLQDRGDRVLFATTSTYFLIKPLMEDLGVTEAISTRLEVENGFTTGRTIGVPIFSKTKMTQVEEYLKKDGISLRDITFYSDSYNDMPLLESAGIAIPVNPDRRLSKEAKLRGWKPIYLKKTLG